MITRWPVAGSRGSPRLASLIYLRKPCHERVLTSSLSTKRSSPLAMPARKWKERDEEEGKERKRGREEERKRRIYEDKMEKGGREMDKKGKNNEKYMEKEGD